METALFLVLLAVAVLIVTGLARKFDLPAPLILISVGIAASFLPFIPEVNLSAEIVLLGFLPPLLYAAALQTSLVDFNVNRRPILLLSIGLVAFTTLGVALLVHALIPGLAWGAAFAIGAVVAPPDAVAATSIARRIGLPRRVVTILEGESLLNDATALVALRTAIAATFGTVSIVEVGLDFALAAAGGVVVGLVTYAVVAWVRRHTTDALVDSAMSFITPFAAYVAAEELHASGVISVVIAGLLLAHKAPILQTASSRIAERMNWRTIAFVLENTVFLLIGLQARRILEDVGDSDLSAPRIVLVCLASLAAVVVLRLVWVFPVRFLLVRPGADRVTGHTPPWTFTFLIGWAGMRGVVTLAAAFVIPEETPHREILLLIAFTVVAGTLLVQGSTLAWVARRLAVPSPDPAEDALARATLLQKASKAGLEKLEEMEEEDPHEVTALIRQRLDQRNFAAWEQLGGTAELHETPSELYARVRLAMIEAERARVLEVRDGGTVASEVVSEVLEMLDVEESMIDVTTTSRGELRPGEGAGRRAGGTACEHLEGDVSGVAPRTPGTCEGCRRDGTTWVHLRMCESCGYVGCCDSSVGKHATEHFHEDEHPVMRSVESGEDWRWCFVHHLTG